MGNRHSANGNKENQLVGLLGEVLTKEVFNVKHKFTNGFDGGFDFLYKNKKVDVKTMGHHPKFTFAQATTTNFINVSPASC